MQAMPLVHSTAQLEVVTMPHRSGSHMLLHFTNEVILFTFGVRLLIVSLGVPMNGVAQGHLE